MCSFSIDPKTLIPFGEMVGEIVGDDICDGLQRLHLILQIPRATSEVWHSAKSVMSSQTDWSPPYPVHETGLYVSEEVAGDEVGVRVVGEIVGDAVGDALQKLHLILHIIRTNVF